MNSRERHENRYRRRVEKRLSHKPIDCDDFNKVFTLAHLYKSCEKCYLNVGWKASTQKYKANALYNVVRTLNQLKTSTYKTGNFYCFPRYERGKKREIRSVHISERVVQKCLCDYSLVEMLSRSFIKDNGACQKGKGEHFAIGRLKLHLREYYKEFKTNDGYILTFDFSKYFDRINHEMLKEIIGEKYNNKLLLNLIFKLIDDFGDIGLGLGSQISQVCALAFPNRLDHTIKEMLFIKGYGRYMDDGYLISNSKDYLQMCLMKIRQICKTYGIVINEKKTHIHKLNHTFTFLQKRFIFTRTGHIDILPAKTSTTKMRRKLKKFKTKVDNGNMEVDDVRKSVMSWIGSAKHYKSYRQIREIKLLFKKLFKEEI